MMSFVLFALESMSRQKEEEERINASQREEGRQEIIKREEDEGDETGPE